MAAVKSKSYYLEEKKLGLNCDKCSEFKSRRESLIPMDIVLLRQYQDFCLRCSEDVSRIVTTLTSREAVLAAEKVRQKYFKQYEAAAAMIRWREKEEAEKISKKKVVTPATSVTSVMSTPTTSPASRESKRKQLEQRELKFELAIAQAHAREEEKQKRLAEEARLKKKTLAELSQLTPRQLAAAEEKWIEEAARLPTPRLASHSIR